MDKALHPPLWMREQAAPEPPRRRREPVFINDCVIPAGGTTLLGLMLRCDLEKLEDG